MTTTPAAGKDWAGGLRLVAVIGPPAVGKSTVTGLAATALGAHVFRLREFADRYQIDHPQLAPDSLLTVRASTRRVCPSCEPDPCGDPHRPAHGLATAPDDCDRCGGRLIPRKSDEAHVFEARLRRFRNNWPHIRTAAAAARVPYRLIDAAYNVTSVSTAFLAACRLCPAAVL